MFTPVTRSFGRVDATGLVVTTFRFKIARTAPTLRGFSEGLAAPHPLPTYLYCSHGPWSLTPRRPSSRLELIKLTAKTNRGYGPVTESDNVRRSSLPLRFPA